jgi:hypothetical protein
MARWSWILWQLFILALGVPLVIGVAWLMRHGNNPNTDTIMIVVRTLVACIMALASCSILNLWIYLVMKGASSTRWLAKGSAWTLTLVVLATLWVRSLYIGVFEDGSEHGAFAGWFAFTLLMATFFVFNFAVLWRKTHPKRKRRHRHRQRGRRSGASSTGQGEGELRARG